MKNSKIIRYSKTTLKENPEMVKYYYEKKIKELDLELEILTKEKYVLDIGLNGKTLNDIERLIVNSKYLAGAYSIKLEYDYAELLDIVSNIEAKNVILVKTNKHLNELKDEYRGVLQRIKSS